jgi:divalent metal cation (Fe/Co/Zn/Cd) transporter
MNPHNEQLYILEIQNASKVSSLPLPLVDRSEEEIAQIIKKKVESIKDVKGVRQLNVRVSGKRVEVDMLALLDDNLEWEDAHRIALNIEREVIKGYPNARVTVHTEPFSNGQESVWRLVKDIAEQTPGSRGVHNIHIQRIDEKLCVDLHLEVSANMTVKQAHDVADQVENKIKASIPGISEVTVHIESASDRVSREMAGVERELESYIEHVAKQFPEIKDVCGIRIRRFGNIIHLVLQCSFDPNLSIEKAHEVSSKLEKAIRTAYPSITRIDIHEEPA